jgi:hypothetical protein
MIKVLTPSGWSDFVGVRKKTVAESFLVGDSPIGLIQCTKEHLFKFGDEFVTADKAGFPIFEHIKDEPLEVYDLVEVAKGNEYFTDTLVSHNCNFHGGIGSLISSSKLAALTFQNPIQEMNDGKYRVFEPIDKKGQYVFSIDVSEGIGGDYSVITIINVSKKPFTQAAVFRSNTTSPYVLAEIVYKLYDSYNRPILLVENNSVGKIVADSLFYEYEIETMISTKMKNNEEQITEGRTSPGIKQTKKTKTIGCTSLKSLIETDILIINDFNTVRELSTFVRKPNGAYSADNGQTDDIAMTLVLFAWAVRQDYFEEITNLTNLKESLRKEYLDKQESEHTAFGFRQEDPEEPVVNIVNGLHYSVSNEVPLGFFRTG